MKFYLNCSVIQGLRYGVLQGAVVLSYLVGSGGLLGSGFSSGPGRQESLLGGRVTRVLRFLGCFLQGEQVPALFSGCELFVLHDGRVNYFHWIISLKI